MATVGERLVKVNTQIDKLTDVGIRRYKTGLSETEKVLMSDLQVERKYLIGLKGQYGLSYDEATDEIDQSTINEVSFV